MLVGFTTWFGATSRAARDPSAVRRPDVSARPGFDPLVEVDPCHLSRSPLPINRCRNRFHHPEAHGSPEHPHKVLAAVSLTSLVDLIMLSSYMLGSCIGDSSVYLPW